MPKIPSNGQRSRGSSHAITGEPEPDRMPAAEPLDDAADEEHEPVHADDVER